MVRIASVPAPAARPGIERIHKKMGEIDTGPGEAQGT
jgi:hypothetical protein